MTDNPADLAGMALGDLRGLWAAQEWYVQLGVGVGLLVLVVLVVWAASTSGSSRRSAIPVAQTRRPGWLARRRAARGTSHPKDGGCTVGRASWNRAVVLPDVVLRLGGLVFGAPGSGKTHFVRLLIQAAALAGRGCIIIDPKGSPALRETVADLGGLVFTIGGWLKWNPLEADPLVMAQQLLAAIPEDSNAPRVYHDGFRLAVLQLGKALAAAQEEPDLRRIVGLLRSGDWTDYCQEHLGADFVAPSRVEAEGVQTGAAGLAALLLGPAGDNLGSGPDCLRLANALERGQIVLLSLPSARGDMTRQLGLWALLGLQAQLAKRIGTRHTPALVILDEAYRLGKQAAQLAVDLMGEGREAGVAVVQVTQGPSDMEEHGRHVLARAAQDAAWVLLFRQGTLDSDRASRLLGMHLVEERTWSEGEGGRRTHSKHVSAPWAAPYELEALGRHTGEAWLRIPAGRGQGVSVEHLQVAVPRPGIRALPKVIPSVVLSPMPLRMIEAGGAERLRRMPRILPPGPTLTTSLSRVSPPGVSKGYPPSSRGIPPVLDGVPEGSDQDEARFWNKVEQAPCGCWLWVSRDVNTQGYPKFKVGKRSEAGHRFAYRRLYGPIPKHDAAGNAIEVDHCCPCPSHRPNKLCLRHLQLKSKPAHKAITVARRLRRKAA